MVTVCANYFLICQAYLYLDQCLDYICLSQPNNL